MASQHEHPAPRAAPPLAAPARIGADPTGQVDPITLISAARPGRTAMVPTGPAGRIAAVPEGEHQMFTGIVEELGSVAAITAGQDSVRLTLHAPLVTADARHGDSIAVNGVCLTVVEAGEGTFTADVMAETLDRSALGALAPGDPVNLERAATLSSRLGGHLVQGHVDGVARLLDRRPGERWDVVTIELPGQLARYVVEKGSITVDGVSLTVSAVTAATFSVSLIPTTLKLTTLGGREPGDLVNLEVDVLAKYVEKLLEVRA